MEQGLTSNTINCIYKDNKNFIWLGTANGLNLFYVFNILSFDQFTNKSVVALAELDSIKLYVSSEKELFLFNRKDRTSIPISFENNAHLTIKAIDLDKANNLFLITNDGLYHVPNNGKITATKIEDSIINEAYLTSILIDENDICWFTSDKGIIRYDINNKSSILYKNSNYSNDNRFLCLSIHKESIYIGTQSSQILKFDTETKQFSDIIKLDTDQIQNITLHNNALYVGTNGNGLKIIDLVDKSISILNYNPTAPNNSISSNAIYSVFIDDSNIWIGTFSGGLNYSSQHRNTFSILDNSVIDTHGLNIRSFHLNGKSNIIGTRNGLIYYSDKKANKFSTDNTPELRSNIILSVQPFRENFLIGTFGGGVNIYDTRTSTIKTFRSEPIFTENSFYSILYDNDNSIWFGTLSGLIKYDLESGDYKLFDTKNSALISNDIYYIEKDSNNRIWIATREGVCFYENGIISQPKEIDISSSGIVRYIYEDSMHNIWLGCETRGVIKIDADLKSFKHYTTNDFLPDNYVSSIIEGNEGDIWMSTSKGIVRYDTKTSDYYIYSLTDGLPGFAFNDGAVQKTTNGKLWWGNEKGLVFLNDSNLSNNSQAISNIIITGIFVDGSVEDADIENFPSAPEYLSSITLPSSQSKSFVFRFSDFEYAFPPSNIYEYMLEGIDEKWHRQIGQNQIVIPIPSAGTYKLLIRKAGSQEPIKAITVIRPKSYTSYITVAAIALIIIAFFFIYRRLLGKYRLQKAKALQTDSSSKVKYQNIRLEKEELDSIKNALIQYMELEQPYLNSELKLDDISSAINYPKTKISQVLNQYLDTNFSNFIASYRIEAFKKKAEEGLIQQYTLSALAKECGFSSRSAFFQSFKKVTGQTPLEFLKDAGIEVDKN